MLSLLASGIMAGSVALLWGMELMHYPVDTPGLKLLVQHLLCISCALCAPAGHGGLDFEPAHDYALGMSLLMVLHARESASFDRQQRIRIIAVIEPRGNANGSSISPARFCSCCCGFVFFTTG